MIHDEAYWTNRYIKDQIQWDTGGTTTPLKAYFDQLLNKKVDILIPGCGNAYEAKYLWDNGFSNVFIADVSEYPLLAFKQSTPEFPQSQLLHENFFDIDNSFDLIVEQTFFCALHPSERSDYVKKMYDLLRPGGKLMGVLFDDPLFDEHPPYGGKLETYYPLFASLFEVEIFERCYNSIKPREDRELFILLKKA